MDLPAKLLGRAETCYIFDWSPAVLPKHRILSSQCQIRKHVQYAHLQWHTPTPLQRWILDTISFVFVVRSHSKGKVKPCRYPINIKKWIGKTKTDFGLHNMAVMMRPLIPPLAPRDLHASARQLESCILLKQSMLKANCTNPPPIALPRNKETNFKAPSLEGKGILIMHRYKPIMFPTRCVGAI